MDNRQHSCTFSGGDNGFCAYHGVFYVGQNAVVYSDLPYYISDCSPNQAPAGVFGNAQADATLDSTIHEVLESATDPESTDKDAWYGKGVVEVADACNYPYTPGDSAYGDPLGGSLSAHTAYNQVIHGHPYYTQEIWAPTTRFAPGCAQRIGPTPDFTATQSGSTMSFDGSYSYDLTRPLTTYVWNYGDGSPLDGSSGIRPRHVYAHPGTYQVSLTVLDATGLQNASTATQTEVVR
jgi:hypothetical protein